MYKSSWLRNVSFALSRFFDSTPSFPIYKRVFGFVLVVSILLIGLDIRISPDANIRTALSGGGASIFTYISVLGLLFCFVSFISPKIYYGWRNRPSLRRKKKTPPQRMVVTSEPTSYVRKKDGE